MSAHTACIDESEDFQQLQGNHLDIQVGIQETANSRAVITGNNLIDGSLVGVTVVDATGTAYQDQDYNNVCYTAATVDGKQQWTPDKDVTLSGEPATLYAYYPWTDGVDISAIPVDMTENDQTDWMYATSVEGLNDVNSTASVKLHHALANVKLTLYKESYSGAGVVTAFSVKSDGAATGGTLNAKTGTFTATVNDGQAITRTVTYTLTDKASATPFDCMVVPTGEEAAMTVTVTVDGHTYSSTTSAFTLAKATAYNLAIKLTSTGLSVTSVSLTDWSETELSDADFKPNTTEDYSNWAQLKYNVTDVSQPVQVLTSYSLFKIDKVSEMAVSENLSRSTVEPQKIAPTLQHTFSTTGVHTVYVKFEDMTDIPMNAFRGCTQLVEANIPNSVTSIGDGAFRECSGLETVVLPNTITKINRYLFSNCTSLVSLSLPTTVTFIGNEAFVDCSNLTSLVIPHGVTTIGHTAFADSGISGELVIPNSVTSIGSNAFKGCSNLNSLTLSNAITEIPSMAFRDCNGLEGELVIPNSVTTISNYAFGNCIKLTGLSIPNSVTDIKDNAFAGCGLKGEIVIPNSVTSIGDEVFKDCSRLSEITIGSGMQSIGMMAFSGCSSLNQITCLAKVAPSLGVMVFSNANTYGYLQIPTGATGYENWMNSDNLGGMRWTQQESEELSLLVDLNTAPNGVYAVREDGNGIPVEYADASCIAVALIVNDSPTPQRIMIEKNGDNNTVSINAAVQADEATENDGLFYWGSHYSDINDIQNTYYIGGSVGSQTNAYLPLEDGSYSKETNNLSTDYTNWMIKNNADFYFALGDFNGKGNTDAIKVASDTDSYTTYANMGTWCTKFNETATENQGFNDWYIPAFGQMALIYLNMSAINEALTKMGGKVLNYTKYYWSSSEYSERYGWILNIETGLISNGSKDSGYAVRFVRDI